MKKTILITGSTDGIGLATARTLLQLGHNVLLHGRSKAKLERAKQQLNEYSQSHSSEESVEGYAADLSILAEVETLAKAVTNHHQQLDVLINNAGVFVVPETKSAEGLDVRFAVNTLAPYLLTKRLLPLLRKNGRVINLSSAAQAPVEPGDLNTISNLADGQIYAQSKLALTMWSRELALSLSDSSPAIIAVNPGSFLGSKMVKEAYGRKGGDLQIGADILTKAALSDEFAAASGLYFDNDIGQFSSPHNDANNPAKTSAIISTMESIIERVI